MDDLEALSREQLMRSRQHEYFSTAQDREQENLMLLNSLGGQIDAYGLQVPDVQPRGQQEFNRLTSGNPMNRPQERYLRLREVLGNAQRNNLQQPQMQPSQPQRAPTMRMPTQTIQGNFNPKHGQAMSFAKALGFGQQIGPENADLAYQAMTAMLRRTPLPVLMHPKRREQTQMEFQTILQQLASPQPQSQRMAEYRHAQSPVQP